METKDIDLQQFCDDESSRYALMEPWNKGGWRYATDGRICVRVTTNEADSPTYNDDGLKRPNASGLFDDFPAEGFAALSDTCEEVVDQDDDVYRVCECAEIELCPKCKGDGWCDDCYDFAGSIVKANPKCETCRGAGKLPRVYQAIGDEWFDRWYLDKVRALPNVRVQNLDQHLLAFVFDGGEGLLMAVMNAKGRKPQ